MMKRWRKRELDDPENGMHPLPARVLVGSILLFLCWRRLLKGKRIARRDPWDDLQGL